MRLVGEARKQGLQFAVADVFRERTIASLIQNAVSVAEEIGSLSAPPQPYDLVDKALRQRILWTISDPANVDDSLPMTDFQAKSIMQPFNYFYMDLHTAYIDQERLRNSCQSLLDHYPLLRATFVQFENQYFQVVLHRMPPSLTAIESGNSLDLACDTICAEDIDRGLSPDERYTKFILVRSNHNIQQTPVSRLIVRLSHAQYDGISLPIMLRTLADIYNDQQQQLPPNPSPDSSFPLYLAHLMRHRSQSHIHRKRRLAGSCNTPITSALSHDPTITTPPESQPFRKVQAEGIIALPQQHHLPGYLPQSTLIGSAWAILLSFITGHDDVVFGHLVANRDLPIPSSSGHDIVGPCVNIIPVRVKVKVPSKQRMTTDVRELPQSMHDQLLSLRETGLMMGWEDIIRSCTDWHSSSTHPTGASASPALESVVQHQNINENPDIHIAVIHAKLHWYENPDAVPAVPLRVVSYLVEGGSKLKIQVLGDSQFITEQMAARLVEYLCEIVRMLVSRGSDENEEVAAWECLYASVKGEFGVDCPKTGH